MLGIGPIVYRRVFRERWGADPTSQPLSRASALRFGHALFAGMPAAMRYYNIIDRITAENNSFTHQR